MNRLKSFRKSHCHVYFLVTFEQAWCILLKLVYNFKLLSSKIRYTFFLGFMLFWSDNWCLICAAIINVTESLFRWSLRNPECMSLIESDWILHSPGSVFFFSKSLILNFPIFVNFTNSLSQTNFIFLSQLDCIYFIPH